jgi:fructan beta-fructosidase
MKRGALLSAIALVLGACSARSVIGVVDDGRASAGEAGGGSGAGVAATAGGGASGSLGAGGAAPGGAGGPSVETGDFDPLFPYPRTTYSEPFRPQFHFSPASGWMNDVDGLWFVDGVFHLTHQANPFAFEGGKGMHWGHATSSDLLHWQQQPLMLAPGHNVQGEAWSGSVVVDHDNTSGLAKSGAPVVAVYTSTALGTSLAYSLDGSASFRSYNHNPVAVGDGDYTKNRDPTVVWHAPSHQWVCVFWEAGGTSFYTSPDLKTWTHASSIAFGDVVPDFYELPLDGDVNDTRWVLQTAGGAYLVGTFDGRTFTPDSPEPRDLDVGPDFYASHTFFRQSFADARVVQIGWLRDGGLHTAPFRGSATFPVELGLKTTPGGAIVSRTPIRELSQLYGVHKHWDGAQLAAGKDLLAGLRSKTVDLELEIDLVKTTAKKLTLSIADQQLSYDLVAQTLQGVPFPARDGKLSLRFLVDWSSVEVFGNAGEQSYSASLPFAPGDATLGLSADGSWSLAAADLREVGRIWPAALAGAAAVQDDADASASYGGDWKTVTGDATFFEGTCHYSTATGSALELPFSGTRLEWYGLRNADLGKADVFIDDELVAEALDCYAPVRVPALLLVASGLSNTFHTLRVVARADKNPSSTGTALVHDYVVSSVSP